MPPFVRDWYQVFPTGGPPTFCYNAAGCFDRTRGRFVLYGGRDSAGAITSDLRTWELYGDVWHDVTTTHAPTIEDGVHAPYEALWMVFDEARDVCVLYYDNVNAVDPPGAARTWEYDGTDWTEFTGTVPRSVLSAAVWDPVGQQIVMWGGAHLNLAPPAPDLTYWTYDGTTWTTLSTANAPHKRIRPALTYDQANSDIVMIGGFTGDASNSWWPTTLLPNDTWTFDLSGTPDWTEQFPAFNPHPDATTTEFGEALGAGSYAEDLGFVIVTMPGGSVATTFTWDGSNWTDAAPSVSPSPDDGIQCWNPEYGKTMYYGGVESGTGSTDVWLYPTEPPPSEGVQVMRWW